MNVSDDDEPEHRHSALDLMVGTGCGCFIGTMIAIGIMVVGALWFFGRVFG